VPYLSASEVMFHEEALYQVCVPLPLFVCLFTKWKLQNTGNVNIEFYSIHPLCATLRTLTTRHTLKTPLLLLQSLLAAYGGTIYRIPIQCGVTIGTTGNQALSSHMLLIFSMQFSPTPWYFINIPIGRSEETFW